MDRIFLVRDNLKINSLIDNSKKEIDFEYLCVIYNYDTFHNGFTDTRNGIEFLKKFLKGGIVFDRRKMIANDVNSEYLGKVNPHGLTGLFFPMINPKLEKELETFTEYTKVIKKNALLKRYGKQIEVVEEPLVSKLFLGDKQYRLQELKCLLKIVHEFVIFDFVWYGFHLNMVSNSTIDTDKIRRISNELDIIVQVLEKREDIPDW